MRSKHLPLILAFCFIVLAGCAGSPIRLNINNHDQNVNFLRSKSNNEICQGLEEGRELAAKYQKKGKTFIFKGADENYQAAASDIFIERGYDPDYCSDPEKYEYIATREIKDYFIDRLHVEVEKLKKDSCAYGGMYKLTLKGTISPDSTFALDKLLEKTPHCKNSQGHLISPTKVVLSSGGGYLQDGYSMGHILRNFGATTAIESENGCASSCAVAFLGGTTRIVDDGAAIMFHAPYHLVKDEYGISKERADCNVGQDQLDSLKSYYIEMIGEESGERIFERTMWYCSSSDGWVVVGDGAAKLFNIATEH